MSISESIVQHIEAWAFSQPETDYRRIDISRAEFHVTIKDQIPISVFNLQTGEPTQSSSESHIELSLTPDGSVMFTSVIAPDSRELFEEIHSSVKGSVPYSINLYEHFQQWVIEKQEELGRKHNISVSRQLFSRAFDVLEAHDQTQNSDVLESYSIQYTLLKSLITQDARESKDLAFSWVMDDKVLGLFNVVSKDAQIWQECGIEGEVGDWNAFMQYVIDDVQSVFSTYMFYVTEFANSFSTFKAPAIVYEEIQRIAALTDPVVSQQIASHISMALLGCTIEEHPWYRIWINHELQSLAAREPVVDVLRDMPKLQELRPYAMRGAEVSSRTEEHVIHLQAHISFSKSSIEICDIVITDESIRIEFGKSGVGKYGAYAEQIAASWSQTYPNSNIRLMKSRNQSDAMVFGLTVSKSLGQEQVSEYLSTATQFVSQHHDILEKYGNDWYYENVIVPMKQEAMSWSAVACWIDVLNEPEQSNNFWHQSDQNVAEPSDPQLFLCGNVWCYEDVDANSITMYLDSRRSVPAFDNPQDTQLFIEGWQEWVGKGRRSIFLEDTRETDFPYDLSAFSVQLFQTADNRITLGIQFDRSAFDQETINALLTASYLKLQELKSSVSEYESWFLKN